MNRMYFMVENDTTDDEVFLYQRGGNKMFARVVTTQGKPERMEEGIRAYREMLLPEIKKMKGFKQSYLMVNRQSGKAIGISIFENEDSARNNELANRVASQVNQKIGANQTSTFEVYEVAVAEVPTPVGMK